MLRASLVFLACFGCEKKTQSRNVFRSPMGNYSIPLELKEGIGEWKYINRPANLVDEKGIRVPQKGMDNFVRQYGGGKSDLVIVSWAPAKEFKEDVREMENLFMNQNHWARTGGPENVFIGGMSGIKESFFINFRNMQMHHYSGIVHAEGRSYTFLASSNVSSDSSKKVFDYFADNVRFGNGNK